MFSVSVPILPQPNIKPIKKENLALTYVERHRDCDLLFQREYEVLPLGLAFLDYFFHNLKNAFFLFFLQLLPEFFKDRTTKASDSIENFYKNRYPDIKACGYRF